MNESNRPPFVGREFHDSSLGHSGKNGHYCECNEGLWVCEDCCEFEYCECFKNKPLACSPLQPAVQKALIPELQ